MKTEPTEALSKLSRVGIILYNCMYEPETEIIDKYTARQLIISAFSEGQSSPKIKQLEWEDTDMWYFKAKTSFRLGYAITKIRGTYIVHFGDAPISWEKSLDSAKVAAQADFEKRVKECLDL